MKTDTQVQQDVIAELNGDSLVNAEHIGVKVKDGVVTLAGRVNSYTELRRAESIVQSLWGVKALAANMGKLRCGIELQE